MRRQKKGKKAEYEMKQRLYERSLGIYRGLTIFIAFNSAMTTSLVWEASGAVNDAFGDSFLFALNDVFLIGSKGEDGISVAWDEASLIAAVGCSKLFLRGLLAAGAFGGEDFGSAAA